MEHSTHRTVDVEQVCKLCYLQFDPVAVRITLAMVFCQECSHTVLLSIDEQPPWAFREE